MRWIHVVRINSTCFGVLVAVGLLPSFWSEVLGASSLASPVQVESKLSSFSGSNNFLLAGGFREDLLWSASFESEPRRTVESVGLISEKFAGPGGFAPVTSSEPFSRMFAVCCMLHICRSKTMVSTFRVLLVSSQRFDPWAPGSSSLGELQTSMSAAAEAPQSPDFLSGSVSISPLWGSWQLEAWGSFSVSRLWSSAAEPPSSLTCGFHKIIRPSGHVGNLTLFVLKMEFRSWRPLTKHVGGVSRDAWISLEPLLSRLDASSSRRQLRRKLGSTRTSCRDRSGSKPSSTSTCVNRNRRTRAQRRGIFTKSNLQQIYLH